jgi:hypothetical protein
MRESCPAFPLAVCEGGFPPSLAFLCVVVFSLLGVIRRLYLEAFSAAGAAFWGGVFFKMAKGRFLVFSLYLFSPTFPKGSSSFIRFFTASWQVSFFSSSLGEGDPFYPM